MLKKIKYIQTTYLTTSIKINTCQGSYKDMWRWKFKNYAVLCNLRRQKIFIEAYETYFLEKVKSLHNKKHK